ncbi:MAG: hypothetical protein RIR49_886, partial [Actinomycetota bacterium]
KSDWQVADVLVFDRQLGTDEIRSMENYLGRSYGIETPGLQATGVSAATVSGQSTQLTVSWTDPTDVTPTSYTIEQSSDAGSTWSTATTSGTVAAAGTTITGLSSSDSYLFRVTPLYANVDNERPSTASTSASPLTATSTALTWSPASPDDTQTVTLTASVTDGGSPVANASVAFAADSTTITGCSAATTNASGEATCSWTPGSAATYTVTATTTGTGLISSTDTQSINVAASTPGQPTGLTATANGTGRVDLSWTAPASGATPTDYKVEYRLTGGDNWFSWNPTTSTSTSESVTGLGSADQYDFRVTAIATSQTGTPSATATATTTEGEIVKQFTSTGTRTWKIPDGITMIDYLVVGGGGGGGARPSSGEASGGGGAGGMLTGDDRDVSSAGDSLSIVVGAGGDGASSSAAQDGNDGDDSSISGSGLSIVALGGGGGAGDNSTGGYDGNSGGSGGGAMGTQVGSVGSSNGSGGAGEPGQGNSGGSNYSITGRPAGGGGGAGGAGGNASASGGGTGGAGRSSSITGTTLVYAAGGGGGVTSSSFTPGQGRDDGAFTVSGDGGRSASGQSASDGRGGGGGGGGGNGGSGGNGGNGVVVLRHAVAGTTTPDLSTSSDTGQSSSDNVTGDVTPTFTGEAQYGATVQLFVDDGSGVVASGSTCSVNSTTYVWTCTTGTLTDDTYDVIAVATVSTFDGVTVNEMSAPLEVTIDSSLSINSITLDDATINTTYSATLTATGGIAPLRWSVTSGSLPTGLSLSSAGVLSGTPTTTGTSTFTVTVTDSNNPQVTDSLALSLIVGLAAQTITFADPADRAWSASTFDVSPTTDGSGLTVSLVSDTTDVCTVTGLTITMVTTGTCTLTASQAGNSTYAAATDVTQSFDITAAAQTITFADPADRVWSDTPTAINPTSDSGLTVSVTTSTPTVCTVSSGSPGLDINVLRSGTCTLTASQAGDNRFAVAPSVTQSFEITAAAQTINFTLPSSTNTVTYGDNPFSVAGTTSSDLVLAFSSSTPTVCTVAGDASLSNGATNAVVSPVGAGSCAIVASQAGDGRYAAASDVSRSFTVAKAAQAALAFTSATSVVWGDTVTAAVSGGSGTGAVTFAAAAGTAGCTINATTGVVSFTSAGTCTLSADKAGDDNHLAATQVAQTLTITKAAQTVTFTSTVPANPLPGGTYTPAATATSGLTPTFTITAGQTTVCSLSSGVVTFLATGTCTITTSQPGDSRYAAASAQTQTISVGSLNQTINVTIPDDVDYGTPGFTLDTDTTSGLTVTITPTGNDICTITGLVVTPVDIGDCELTITQTGNSRYAPASPVTISFRILPAIPTAPTITSVSAGNANATIAFTAPGFTGGVDLTAYTITATPTTGDPITDTSCTSSPCTITGLANGTNYTLTITANNTAGAGPASTSSPAITPATRATAVTTLAATPGNGTMRVTWGAPADFGGGTFTRYELRIAPNGDSMPSAATATVTSSTTGNYTFTGLENGVAYNVEVVTITTANQASIEGNTATLSSVPVSTPAQPETLTVNEFSPRVIRVTWSEPLRDGGAAVTGYTVTITGGDGVSVECGTITIEDGTRSADCTSDLLELSTTYTVTVAAVNRIGAGAASSVTHTTPTFTAPSTPPVVNTDDDDAAECPCIYDPDGNPVPVDIERSEPGVTPGSVTIGDGSSTIRIGGDGDDDDSDGSIWVDADGQLTVRPPAGLPFNGSGGLPGTTVTVFVDGVAVGAATVDDDGNWRVVINLPAGTTGPIDATIVWIDADGNQQTLNVPIGIYTPVTNPPDITIDDDDGCPCVFDADGNPVPVDVERTPTGQTPGQITIGDGTITLGATTTGSGQATTWIDSAGRFTAHTPGSIPLSGADALPGTTVTIFWNGTPIGTATVNPDGTWTLDLDLPAGTNGPGTLTIIWTDTTGAQRTLSTPMTIIATGDAATAPRAPTGGTQLAPDPDTAIALGPNGERLDTTRTPNPATNTITITVGDTALTVTPVDSGRVGTDGRLNVTHPARIRVTGNGMLPGATATIWVMSTPQRLGTITINTDGTIDTTYTLPTTIDPGNHTIQIDSVALTGQAISIALGFTITTGLLPTTGTNTDTHLAWMILITALGALTTLTTTGNRRRRTT